MPQGALLECAILLCAGGSNLLDRAAFSFAQCQKTLGSTIFECFGVLVIVKGFYLPGLIIAQPE